MLCNSVGAVFVGVLFTPHPSVGWRVFSRQPKPVLTLRKITNRQGLKNAENSNCSSSTGFGPNLTTMTKLFAGITATLYRTSNMFSGQLRSHFLRCPETVVLFAALFVDCEEWFCILLGPCQALVVQSFAFSFRLGKVGSLIEWWLRSFCM